jgi:hypothetical protein
MFSNFLGYRDAEIATAVHKPTKSAIARNVDKDSQKPSRCLKYGGRLGVVAQMATLAVKIPLTRKESSTGIVRQMTEADPASANE